MLRTRWFAVTLVTALWSAASAAPDGASAQFIGDDEFAAEREACVDYINMYRATLDLPPLERGTPEQEACSDVGAEKDGASREQHSSARDCNQLGLSSQNSCPGWPVSTGRTLIDSLKSCLDAMWNEGEPPEGTTACIRDESDTDCFLRHGHWIIMSSMQSSTVACGFYRMPDGSYWMNQNYGR